MNLLYDLPFELQIKIQDYIDDLYLKDHKNKFRSVLPDIIRVSMTNYIHRHCLKKNPILFPLENFLIEYIPIFVYISIISNNVMTQTELNNYIKYHYSKECLDNILNSI